jgi:hypothetical protein
VSDPCAKATWSVWRTDDNGNTFLVRDGLAHEQAQRLVAEFTARGHKQLYFAQKSEESGPARAGGAEGVAG